MALDRKAELVLGADHRRLKRDLAHATREMHTFGRNAGERLRSGFSASVGSLATLGSAAGLAAIGKDVLAVDENLTRMGIQAGKSDAEMGRFRHSATEIGLEFGMTRESVVSAASAMVDLMGAEAATVENMNLLARASTATGAAVTDLAGTYYALDNAFDFQNMKDAEQALSGVIEAGKQGSIPLAEMSAVLQQQATSLAKLTRNASDAASVLQIVRKGFGSAAEAGTGVKALVNTLEGSADKLRSLGIRVYTKDADGNRVLRELDTLLDQVDKHDLFNNRNYVWAMGSAEARKALEMLVQHRQKLDEIREAARRSNAVQEDSAKFLSSSAGRMRLALARMRHEVESLFTPERLQQFTHAAELLADGLGYAVDHVEELAAAIGTLYALRFTAAVVGWTRALLAFNKGVRGAADQLDGLTGKTGKVDKLASALGWLGSAAGAASVGWTVGSMVADYLGVGADDSARSDAEANQRNLAEKRAELERSQRIVDRLARGELLGWQDVDVSSYQELDELRTRARRVQEGTASPADRLALARQTRGAYLFREDSVRNRDGSVRYVGEQDTSREITRLEREVARDEAAARNQARLERWNDEAASTALAREFLRTEFQGGDKTITGDEIYATLSQKGLLTELALSSKETSEMSVSRQMQANQMLVEKMAELIEAQKQQYGRLGQEIKVELSLDGQKLGEATANTQHAARSIAE